MMVFTAELKLSNAPEANKCKKNLP